ncbi:DUF2500 domain-containing protein [Paenibacillus sp. p3-SID1389]|uniref:DUF2500 domain-containing protein n=1 Tax=Paenibacillus sp. p3-SID1389 TaxID=2916364 RepID=UPI0021A873CC|nr:DUF2500 domain-containing protein [Paenibacillus sp. p3-SID1389]MCT2196911.1 DUF2500 domain-containing protein [Paenibacillus sp. p3-SID1389]
MGGFDPSPFGGGGFGGGGDIMFTIIPVFMVIFFVIFIVLMISSGVRYAKNARSPRETRYARIISKRMDVQHSSSHIGKNNTMHSSSSRTYYYITLEFDNGSRQEYLDVKNLYGLVAEGDVGYAAVQGDWIVAFERDVSQRPNGGTY